MGAPMKVLLRKLKASDRLGHFLLCAPIEGLRWQLAKRALALGVDVILEFGFWSRAERRKFRCPAGALGSAR